MKPLLLMFGNVAFAVSVLGGVLAVATNISASEPGISPLRSVYSEGIWTREPTRIDRDAQKFQRIEAAASVARAPVGTEMKQVPVGPQVASLDPAIGMQAPAQDTNMVATTSVQHQQWCNDRYNSYNPADNTYRAYSGQRRACRSPFDQQTGIISSSGQQQPAVASLGVNAQACMRRYRSYDIATNTYQPFDGGPRRPCVLTR